jgi:hypothetical protein
MLAVGLCVLPAHAEDDGHEMLQLMEQANGHEVAQPYVNIVWRKWNGSLFCIPADGDRDRLAYDAVHSYLTAHPEELSRPRRYLIIQGLCAAYPCQEPGAETETRLR